MPRRILILYAHPGLPASRTNAKLVEAADALPQVTVRDLYRLYPNGVIDTRAEQQALLQADIIVSQYPFFWYSMPSLLKEWVDSVLDYGWAYGPGGDKLKDKPWLHAVTTGGNAQAYDSNAPNRYSISTYLAPQEQTAVLCHMPWLPPFVVHDANRLDEAGTQQHTITYQHLLEQLSQ
jgi:glutathione-regulated potassium-efflux system ancillary protein KefG